MIELDYFIVLQMKILYLLLLYLIIIQIPNEEELKNSSFISIQPHSILMCDDVINCISICPYNPKFLCIGMNNGDINIYEYNNKILVYNTYF